MRRDRWFWLVPERGFAMDSQSCRVLVRGQLSSPFAILFSNVFTFQKQQNTLAPEAVALFLSGRHTHTRRDGRDPTIACGGDSIFYFHQERALDTITHRHTRNKLSSCTTGAFPPARNNKVEKSKSRLSSKDAPAPSTAQVFQPWDPRKEMEELLSLCVCAQLRRMSG